MEERRRRVEDGRRGEEGVTVDAAEQHLELHSSKLIFLLHVVSLMTR